ncbi:MAG: single-stranded DNA-binding protein [Acidimicrobiia bacterium]|nr:single-stranded DNA-binding protein [Acidimicrobiia bacterium]
MDLNLVVLAGTLAAAPDLREFDSGARLLRMLVTVRSDEPRRRVDVIPVTLWDPPTVLTQETLERGRRVVVCGAAQRRFWEAKEGRRNRVEIVAENVTVRPEAEAEDDDG